MGKWNKTCHSFKKVRSMLEEGVHTKRHCKEIMDAIENCCDELISNDNTGWAFSDAFRDLKEEIHEASILGMDETDYEDCEDIVNWYLDELYDLCDAARVWLAM